jgi:hypothetical protein
MKHALNEIRSQRCKFIVAGRLDSKIGEYLSLNSISIPKDLSNLFVELPAFRVDISSTELRMKRNSRM